MEHGYRGSEPSFKSLTFSPFIITRHSLGTGFTADWEGRQERAWPAINLSKLEMSRPAQPRRRARGALVSPAELPSRHRRPHIPYPPPPASTSPDVCPFCLAFFSMLRSLAYSQTPWSPAPNSVCVLTPTAPKIYL